MSDEDEVNGEEGPLNAANILSCEGMKIASGIVTVSAGKNYQMRIKTLATAGYHWKELKSSHSR